MKTYIRTGLVTLILWCLLPAPAAQAAGRGECLSLRSRILAEPVAYCVLLPPGYDADKARRFPVLYFLHGLGDNEQMFFRSGGWNLVQQLWERRELGEFIIVTPRAGSSFYLNSRDGQYRYEDFLLQEFVPLIENRYRIRAGRAFRGVAGISMGGYGALRFALKYPQTFSAVAVHSAALFETLPEDASLMFGRNFRAFGSPLDPAYWDQNNPLTLARSASGLSQLQIYFDCGLQDSYGFDAGARVLHEILEQRKVPHEFHLYPGGHDWQYIAEHFPESLAFLSRALGLK